MTASLAYSNPAITQGQPKFLDMLIMWIGYFFCNVCKTCTELSVEASFTKINSYSDTFVFLRALAILETSSTTFSYSFLNEKTKLSLNNSLSFIFRINLPF